MKLTEQVSAFLNEDVSEFQSLESKNKMANNI